MRAQWMRIDVFFGACLLTISLNYVINNVNCEPCPDSCSCPSVETVLCRHVQPDEEFFTKNWQLLVNARTLAFSSCPLGIPLLNLTEFCWLRNLSSLSLCECGVERVQFSANGSPLSGLRFFSLSGNNLIKLNASEHLMKFAPSLLSLDLGSNRLVEADLSGLLVLERLDLSRNRFLKVPKLPQRLQWLNISENVIDSIFNFHHHRLHVMDLSGNRLTVLQNAGTYLTSLHHLNASRNSITAVRLTNMNKLISLDLSWNQLSELSRLEAAALVELNLAGNKMQTVPSLRLENLSSLILSNLSVVSFSVAELTGLRKLVNLDLSGCVDLRTITGSLETYVPALSRLDVSDTALQSFEVNFFQSSRLERLRVVGCRLHCDCRQLWRRRLSDEVFGRDPIPCLNVSAPDHCPVGVAEESGRVFKLRLGRVGYLQCGEYGYEQPNVLWEIYRFKKAAYEPICQWIPVADEIVRYQGYSSNGLYCLPGGLLALRLMHRDEASPVRCTAMNGAGNATAITLIHFDFSHWWKLKMDSFICAIATMVGLLVVNIVYIVIRRLIVWRISKMERTSRVRRLLEAMEKYRQRQLEALYEKYAQRTQQIVDNYHQQVEQLKKGYMAQSERFRDYRAAQMESVTHQIDSVRVAYAQQAQRFRDYSSRQMERLWESYERQLNRLRTFTLQQRLRVMRQYKFPQQYINKLLENFYSDSANKIRIEYPFIDPNSFRLPDLTSPEHQLPAMLLVEMPGSSNDQQPELHIELENISHEADSSKANCDESCF
ncbi:Uncharacterized protein T11_3925 [Trichinella zimbabwensis]|uniref:Uncharacterized protein n=1 Tax=Trichinella zimbabwensis TaxID=268475 RepID=A0A0V1I352_9BILA|nr:Uncharacterized protein T11_3925 [Trichinella zimbabwensis]